MQEQTWLQNFFCGLQQEYALMNAKHGNCQLSPDNWVSTYDKDNYQI